MRAAGLKEDLWSKHTDAPAVVLPAPAADTAAGTVFEIDFRAAGRADAKDRRATAVDAVGKLHPYRIVAPKVVLRFGAKPQAIRPAGFRVEDHLEVVRRIDSSGRDLGHTRVGLIDTTARGGGQVRHDGPTTYTRGRLPCVKNNL